VRSARHIGCASRSVVEKRDPAAEWKNRTASTVSLAGSGVVTDMAV